MNPNDIIAHYAAERLQLMVELQQAKGQIAQLEAKLKELETDNG
jgi:hypothetical protein